MARNQNVRVQPAVLRADEAAFQAVMALADYQSANPAYSLVALMARNEALHAAHAAALHTLNAAAAARDALVAAQWEQHNFMLGVKEQVIAQYGNDSDQVASLGLKKKSERKAARPMRRPAA